MYEIGQALRIAMGYGMHTDMPTHILGEATVERCRRAWWTVYILDREMTTLVGLPQSIHDEHINAALPKFSGLKQQGTELALRVRFYRAIIKINQSAKPMLRSIIGTALTSSIDSCIWSGR